jgi:DNA polymerase elongation subunit (family B)
VIFNETKVLFEKLVDRLRGIYGDTDSVYVPLSGDPYPDGEVTAAAQEIARELWGDRLMYGGSHFRLKLEGVWDVFIYQKKNYIKWSGEKIEAKGQVFKPSGLPAGWKYGNWRRLLVEFAEGRRCWLEELKQLPPEDAMLEESMDLADFFTASKGEDLKVVDWRKRLPILAKLLAESGGRVYSLKKGARGLVDVRYLFLARGAKHASLVVYVQDRFVRVDISGVELVKDESGRPIEARVAGTHMPISDVEAVYRTAASTYTALKNVFGNCKQEKLV